MRMSSKQKQRINEAEKKGFRVMLTDYDGRVVVVKNRKDREGKILSKTIRRIIERDGTITKL